MENRERKPENGNRRTETGERITEKGNRKPEAIIQKMFCVNLHDQQEKEKVNGKTSSFFLFSFSYFYQSNIEPMQRIILCFTLFLPLLAHAQDLPWWDKLHGRTPDMPEWRSWMIISPGYLGVNALPIPTQLKGQIARKPELELAIDFHFLTGEQAQNIYIRYFHPFANGKIALEISGVPFERYAHDEALRNSRKSRIEDGKGWGLGDLYFTTNVALLDREKWPSLVLRLACKTASGELHGARFSDTPGYWFDLSSRYDFQSGAFILRPFGMLGFYAWQTTSDALLQNDAIIWGGGFEVLWKKFRLEQSVQGYNGWRQEKDCPYNYRLIAAMPIGGSEFKIEYQHGLRDVLYRSFRLAYVLRF